MILKSKNSHDIFIADSLINVDEVLMIYSAELYAGRTTVIKFKPELSNPSLKLVLAQEQHNELVDQLSTKYEISQSAEAIKSSISRKLRVGKDDEQNKTIVCQKEN